MKFSWFYRIVDYFSNKKHAFVVQSTTDDNTTEIVNMLSTPNNNVGVDVYSNCEDLFFNLNRCKSYYQIGVINKNDKKNTANILTNLVNSTNPKIKMVTYSDKKSFKTQLSM